MQTGALYSENGICTFRVWAPFADSMSLKLISPEEKLVSMQNDESGYWETDMDDVHPGASYFFLIDGKTQRPDPASFFQPEGVHNASVVIDHSSFQWGDTGWQGIPMRKMIMYEVHIGTLTSEGTFASAVPLLDELRDLGINTVEIMPVSQFPGDRNWGYDGVYPFAVQNSYGGPEGLKHFVNECHSRGMAVILDVVYNHFGPEGNYTRDFGPYFTDRYKTPWGDAINFDDAYSNEVRNFFIENAIYWFKYYHIDALRLDAIHGIFDMGARHFLLELAERTKEFSKRQGRKYYLIAESDLNDARVAGSPDRGGYGIDGLWCDDFHHSVHTLLTCETDGYYADFGGAGHLAKSLKEGFVYSGQYSEYRKRNHGISSKDVSADRFVVCVQNHDQVGNRIKGERLARLVSFEAQKLAAGVMLLSPYVPLLFMGEEYGETIPFLYFVSHTDPDLIEAVRQGRKKEFESFQWHEEPPDPQSPDTFRKSVLDRGKRLEGRHRTLYGFYRKLIYLRKHDPVLAVPDNDHLEVSADEAEKAVYLKRWKEEREVFAAFNFNKKDIILDRKVSGRGWKRVLDSSETQWDGPGSLLPEELSPDSEIKLRGKSFILYSRRPTNDAPRKTNK